MLNRHEPRDRLRVPVNKPQQMGRWPMVSSLRIIVLNLSTMVLMDIARFFGSRLAFKDGGGENPFVNNVNSATPWAMDARLAGWFNVMS